MKTIPYFFVLALIAVNHFLVPGWWQIPVWCIIGIGLSLPRAGIRRSFFLRIVVPEILVAIGFVWIRQGSISAAYSRFSEFSIPWWGWMGIVVGVNMITALLCMYTFFCIGRLLISRRVDKPAETVTI